MGILRKAADTRTHQILRNELGKDVEIDFIAGGSFTCEALGFSIRPFMSAVNDQGIFFIQNSRIVFVLPWSSILWSKKEPLYKGLKILFRKDEISHFQKPTQFPNCYWHSALLVFNHEADEDLFQKEFDHQKEMAGFTKLSLKLYERWTSFEMGMPDSYEDYRIRMTSDEYRSGPSKVEIEHYLENRYDDYGNHNEVEKFLNFIARSVCQGLIPGKVLTMSYEEWLRPIGGTSDYSPLQAKPLEGQSLDLFARTLELPWKGAGEYDSTNDSKDWFLAKIEVAPDEWQSLNVRAYRPIAVQITNSTDNLPTLTVWNDYHQGDSLVVLDTDIFRQTCTVNLISVKIIFEETDLDAILNIWK